MCPKFRYVMQAIVEVVLIGVLGLNQFMCQVNQPSNWVAFFFFFCSEIKLIKLLKRNNSRLSVTVRNKKRNARNIKKARKQKSEPPLSQEEGLLIESSRHPVLEGPGGLSFLKTWRIESTRSSIFVQRDQLRVGLKSHIRPITNSSEWPLQRLEPMPLFHLKKGLQLELLRVHCTVCRLVTGSGMPQAEGSNVIIIFDYCCGAFLRC